MDKDLTNKIKNWLDSPAAERDIMIGAKLLLQVSRNQIIYRNAVRDPARYADRVAYELRKIFNNRLRVFNKAEVAELMKSVDKIAADRGLDKPKAEGRSAFQLGKRADHDDLPDEIQKLWVDNADIMRKMRDCHTHLRLITPQNSTCPDSDRYPWAKEIIRLDKLYRNNFNVYDHFVKGTPIGKAPVTDSRTASKNAVKSLHLALGRYAKNPNEELAKRIKSLFAQVVNPDDKLKAKMRNAGLI